MRHIDLPEGKPTLAADRHDLPIQSSVDGITVSECEPTWCVGILDEVLLHTK